MGNIIESHHLSKTYNPDTIPVHAVNNVDLAVEEGDAIGVIGRSGTRHENSSSIMNYYDELILQCHVIVASHVVAHHLTKLRHGMS